MGRCFILKAIIIGIIPDHVSFIKTTISRFREEGSLTDQCYFNLADFSAAFNNNNQNPRTPIRLHLKPECDHFDQTRKELGSELFKPYISSIIDDTNGGLLNAFLLNYPNRITAQQSYVKEKNPPCWFTGQTITPEDKTIKLTIPEDKSELLGPITEVVKSLLLSESPNTFVITEGSGAHELEILTPTRENLEKLSRKQ